MRRATRWFLMLALALLALVGSAGVLRAFVIVGPSDAPSLLWGDFVLANTAAYEVRLPFTYFSPGKWRAPARGDMVLFRVPSRPGVIGFKHIVAVPGDVVGIRDGKVLLNGSPLRYVEQPSYSRATIVPHN